MEITSSAAPRNACNLKKKKRGPIHLIRVALYMIKQNKSKKKNNAVNSTSSLWKNFVGSMRPLHAQNHHHSPPPQLTETAVDYPTSPEHMEVFTPPMSPAPASVSSWGNRSQYASALNLHELDDDHDDDRTVEIENDQRHDDDDDDGDRRSNGDKEGDNMIDYKAEEFIAQFYHQIKVQNQVYNHRRHKMMN